MYSYAEQAAVYWTTVSILTDVCVHLLQGVQEGKLYSIGSPSISGRRDVIIKQNDGSKKKRSVSMQHFSSSMRKNDGAI